MSLLAKNRRAVLDRIAAAARASGRRPEEVRLVAVTKSVEPDLALALHREGQEDLGESRVDELERKARALAAAGAHPRWHFVGHLQRNKARRVARVAAEIHSVDSEALLGTLERGAREEGARPGVYLQVKLARERSKHGLDEAAVLPLAERAARGPLPLLGLMTIAPLVRDEAAARRAAREVFERLAALARALPAELFEEGRPRLSMGMSGDLEEAVAAGSDVVRVGSALFEGLPGRTAPTGEPAP